MTKIKTRNKDHIVKHQLSPYVSTMVRFVPDLNYTHIQITILDLKKRKKRVIIGKLYSD